MHTACPAAVGPARQDAKRRASLPQSGPDSRTPAVLRIRLPLDCPRLPAVARSRSRCARAALPRSSVLLCRVATTTEFVAKLSASVLFLSPQDAAMSILRPTGWLAALSPVL